MRASRGLRSWTRRVALWLMAVGLVLGVASRAVGLAPMVPVPPAAVVPAAGTLLYTQQPATNGGLLPSALRDPDGSASDAWVWDGFTSARNANLIEFQWIGGYEPLAGPSPLAGFVLSIYASVPSGAQPDLAQPPLASWEIAGAAGETAAEVLGGVQTYRYAYAPPTLFTAAAGVKYWLQIEALQGGVPSWGLVLAAEGDGWHFRRINSDGFNYQVVLGDAAFSVLGTPLDSNLAWMPLVVHGWRQAALP